MSKSKTRLPDFEASMAELEALVEKLEAGDLPLEDALKHFERGVALTRACQTALKSAEQKVEILLKSQSGDTGADDDPTGEFFAAQDFEPES